jgi:prepilin-type N-terminal cleavage/methylation domain-containing protein
MGRDKYLRIMDRIRRSTRPLPLRGSRPETDHDGFTLIEIMVVIVVLGILAAVVIFALGGIPSKSARAACTQDGATLSSAIADFNNQNPTTTVTPSLLTGKTDGGPYVQSWPDNTPHYAYAISDGTSTYAIPTTTVTGTVTTVSPVYKGLYAAGTTDYPAGVLLISTGGSASYAGATETWTYTPIANSVGNLGSTGVVAGTAATAPWMPYLGPDACGVVG